MSTWQLADSKGIFNANYNSRWYTYLNVSRFPFTLVLKRRFSISNTLITPVKQKISTSVFSSLKTALWGWIDISYQETKSDHCFHISKFVAPGESYQTRRRGSLEIRDKEEEEK